MGKEIEKKFLIYSIPETVDILETKEIHQTYLALGDEELRVRKAIKNGKEKYTLTIKRGSGLVREEIETEISSSTYEQLLSSTNKKPLIKTRNVAKLISGCMEYNVEIDTYQNITGLIVAEIEFPTETAANNFTAPEWFGDDVTEIKDYKNQNLWKKIQ